MHRRTQVLGDIVFSDGLLEVSWNLPSLLLAERSVGLQQKAPSWKTEVACRGLLLVEKRY